MKNRNIVKTLGVFSLSGFMLMGTALPAFAEEVKTPGIIQGGTQDKPAELEITKDFVFNEGLAVPEVTFNFKIAAITDDAPKASISPIKFGNVDKKDIQLSDGVQSLTKKVKVVFNSEFPHAGVYKYKVTETDDGTSNVTYDKREYYLDVHVANSSAMDGTTYIKAFVSTSDGGKAPIEFKNIYAKNNNLIIEKQIKGEMANLNKKFEFEVTIGDKEDVNKQHEFKAVILNKTGDTVKNLTFQAGVSQTVQLGHNEQLKFTDVEVGTRYTVKEVGAADGYTPSATIIENGTTSTAPAVAEDKGLEVTNKLVGEKDNKVTFVNEYNEITVTGIIENNLPFILMICVAGIGLSALAVAKKRKTAK